MKHFFFPVLIPQMHPLSKQLIRAYSSLVFISLDRVRIQVIPDVTSSLVKIMLAQYHYERKISSTYLEICEVVWGTQRIYII